MKFSFRPLAALALVTLSASAAAFDVTPTHITIHTFSAHDKSGLNNINPGIGFRWENASGNGPVAGVYCNSFNAVSAYAGYAWEWSLAPQWSASLAVGGVTGYPELSSQFKGQSSGNAGCTRNTADERARPKAALLPFVLPSISYRLTPKQAVVLGYIPKVHPKGSGVYHVILEHKF